MTRVVAHAVQGNLVPLPNVRNVIAVTVLGRLPLHSQTREEADK